MREQRVDPRAPMATHLAGLALLREAASVLAGDRIALMPLKGIWLQQLAYDSPEQRAITDVDVLVQEDEYAPALLALERAGFRRRSENATEACLGLPGWALPLDLHRALFTRFAFALPTADLFARGRVDSAQFGCTLVLPDPLDVVAHLIGHHVKSRAAGGDARLGRDLQAIADRFAPSADQCARRLEVAGLARAARYALSPLADDAPQGFAARLLAALAADPIGEALARACRAGAGLLPANSRVHALLGFALERSLPAGARALGARVQDQLGTSIRSRTRLQNARLRR